MTKTKAAQKKLGEEGFNVRVIDVFMQLSKKEVKAKWIASHDLWLAEILGQTRVITPVVLAGLLQWMDCVTGTVYAPNGWCATSGALSIKEGSIHKNDLQAECILMNLRGGE